MSLQIAAKHLAAKGRGPDTTLVHMTNKEVQGLQALAEKNGGSLSINPDTGLPEAGFLESILPVVAGVGLTAAGMGPMAAALTVGGVSTLSTGSLSKGLFAGLGAYGGASLGQQLAVQGMGEAAAANASFGDKLAGMGDASAFSSFENAGKFISASPKLPLLAAAAGPLLSGMEEDRENDKPSEPVKDTDPGARARSGIKFNPGYLTPTPLPNPYGIEQTYATPYYAAEGGVTHMAEGGMAYGGSTSGPIDTKAQFADYLNKVMNPTTRTNAVSGSTNPFDWWKSQSRPAAPAPTPIISETPEEYAARTRLNARGGDGGMTPEQRAEQAADNDRPQPMLNGLSRNEYFGGLGLSPEEQNAVRAQADMDNPKTAAALNFVKLAASPVKFLYDKLAPAPVASEMQKYIDAADAESRTLTRDRAFMASPEGIAQQAADAMADAESRDRDAFTFSGFNDNNDDRYTPAPDPFAGYSPSELAGASMTAPEVDFIGAQQAEIAALRAEQAQQLAAEQKQFERDTLQRELKQIDSLINEDPSIVQGEGDSGLMLMDKVDSLNDQINRLDSPFSDRFAPSDPYAGSKDKAEALQQARENLERGDRFAPVPAGLFDNQYLSPDAYNALNEARIDAMIAGLPDAQQVTPSDMGARVLFKQDTPDTDTWGGGINASQGTRTALNPFPGIVDRAIDNGIQNIGTYTPGQFQGAYLPDVPGEISAAPDDATLSQFTNAFYGDITPLGYVGEATQLAGINYTGGIPDANAGISGLPGVGGLYGGPGWGGVGVGFGGLGSSWQGVTDRNGDSVMTSQGAAEKSFRDSPEGLAMQKSDINADRESRSIASGLGAPATPTPGYSAADARADSESQGGSRDGGGGQGGGGRVICTHFYRKGEMSRDMWRADLEFTFKNLSKTTVRGYQYWAIPYVKLMRKSKLAENVMRPLAMHRAQELAYQMGRTPKGSLFGKVVRLIGEPICFAIGLFVGEQNWQSLWNPAKD